MKSPDVSCDGEGHTPVHLGVRLYYTFLYDWIRGICEPRLVRVS